MPVVSSKEPLRIRFGRVVAEDRVVARPAIEGVIARPARDGVIPAAGADVVVAVVAEDRVVPFGDRVALGIDIAHRHEFPALAAVHDAVTRRPVARIDLCLVLALGEVERDGPAGGLIGVTVDPDSADILRHEGLAVHLCRKPDAVASGSEARELVDAGGIGRRGGHDLAVFVEELDMLAGKAGFEPAAGRQLRVVCVRVDEHAAGYAGRFQKEKRHVQIPSSPGMVTHGCVTASPEFQLSTGTRPMIADTVRQECRVPAVACPVAPQRPSTPQSGLTVLRWELRHTKRILVRKLSKRRPFESRLAPFMAASRRRRKRRKPQSLQGKINF
jgi:hypothetical protein